MSHYSDMFSVMDRDGDGGLDMDEVMRFCAVLPKPPASHLVQRLFEQADSDRSGQIDKYEFGALCEGLKVLCGMETEAMVEAFSRAELKKVFNVVSNRGVVTRDEMRKMMETLNESLGLKHTHDKIVTILRAESQELDAGTFHRVITVFTAGRSVAQVAQAFLDQENERKTRVSKARKFFASATAVAATVALTGAASPRGSPRDGAEEEGPCMDCLEKDDTIVDLKKAANDLEDEVAALRRKLSEKDEQLMQAAVEASKQSVSMSAGAEEQQAQLVAARAELAERAAQQHLDQETIQQLRDTVARLVAEQEASSKNLETYRKHNAEFEVVSGAKKLLQAQLEEAKSQIESLTEERVGLKTITEQLRRRCAEQDDRIERTMTEQREEVSTKHEEIQRLMQDMDLVRGRNAELEQDVATMQVMVQETNDTMRRKHDEILAREGEVEQERRRLQDLELSLHEEVARRRDELAKLEAEQQKRFEARDHEIHNKEAEVKVRESIVDQTIRRQEAVALPERERRMRLLQQIERDLYQREKSVRKLEAASLPLGTLSPAASNAAASPNRYLDSFSM